MGRRRGGRSNGSKRSKRARLPRGSKSISQSISNRKKYDVFDLDVPLVASHKGRTKQNTASILIQRLRNTGFTAMAFSQTVKGSKLLDPVKDSIPPDIIDNGCDISDGMSPSSKRKRKRVDIASNVAADQTSCNKSGINRSENPLGMTVLRRLNVVIERVSDLAHYSNTTTNSVNALSNTQHQKHKDTLKSYDLIALTPLNDETFTSSCLSTNLLYCDIITLDYTKGRGTKLPYKIRTADVRAATDRGITFEIPYGPALVDPSKRRALVRTARLLGDVCLGINKPHPSIILSSGRRMVDGGEDSGVMTLRSHGDLKNFTRVVMGWDDVLVSKIMTAYPLQAVLRARNRKLGKQLSDSEDDALNFTVSLVEKGRSGKEGLVIDPMGPKLGVVDTPTLLSVANEHSAECVTTREISVSEFVSNDKDVESIGQKRYYGEDSDNIDKDGFLKLE